MKKAFLACVLALSLLPVFADSDSYLLGGFIADWVGEEESSGLVNIEGIRASVWDATLPLVEDLTVYLRWEGEGEHVVTLTLYDETGEAVDQIEEDVDFGDWSTLYTTHEMENIVFEKPGFYDVFVSLDGEDLLSIPYCVNVEEDEYPVDPWLLASLPAVDGYGDEEGKGVVEGAFEHFIFKKLPGADDFAIVSLWIGGDGLFDHRVEVKDPAGNLLAASEDQYLDAYPGELSVVTDYFENFLFSAEGDYEVSVYLDDEEVLFYMMRVIKE